jgi:hypothetical protein
MRPIVGFDFADNGHNRRLPDHGCSTEIPAAFAVSNPTGSIAINVAQTLDTPFRAEVVTVRTSNRLHPISAGRTAFCSRLRCAADRVFSSGSSWPVASLSGDLNICRSPPLPPESWLHMQPLQERHQPVVSAVRPVELTVELHAAQMQVLLVDLGPSVDRPPRAQHEDKLDHRHTAV